MRYTYTDVTVRPTPQQPIVRVASKGRELTVDGVRQPDLAHDVMGVSVAASPTSLLVVAKDSQTGALVAVLDGVDVSFGGFCFELEPHCVWHSEVGFVVAWQDSPTSWRWRRLGIDQDETPEEHVLPMGESSQGYLGMAVRVLGGEIVGVDVRRTDDDRLKTIDGVHFYQFSTVETPEGLWTVGQGDIGVEGGVVVANETTGEKWNVAMLPTQVPVRIAANDHGDVVVAISIDSDGPLFFDRLSWGPLDLTVPKQLPSSPRACAVVDGGGAHLRWGVDVEGSYWAYDLFRAGAPARFLFHDLRAELSAQFRRPVEDTTGTTGTTLQPLLHDGEPVSTLWLAKRTGATIIAYHDENVDTTDPVKLAALVARLVALDEVRQAGYGIIIGDNGYPRVVNGKTQSDIDATWCVERHLELYDGFTRGAERHPFLACVILALWRGNRLPSGDLAYDEGTLDRIWISAARIQQQYPAFAMVAGLGDGRNDVSAWCKAYRAAWGERAEPLALDVFPRTTIADLPPPPPPPVDDPPPVDAIPPGGGQSIAEADAELNARLDQVLADAKAGREAAEKETR